MNAKDKTTQGLEVEKQEEPQFTRSQVEELVRNAAQHAMTQALEMGGRRISELEARLNEVEREARTSRTQENRASDQVHEEYPDLWQPRGLLDTSLMPPRPGFVQRWIRTLLDGKEDHRNVARQYNMGWRPRTIDSVPEDVEPPSTTFGKWTGVIGIEGVILMERPEALHAAYGRRIKEDTRAQMAAVDATMKKVRNPGEPFGEPTVSTRRRSATRGADPTFGRKARVAPD